MTRHADHFTLGIETSCDDTSAAVLRNGGEILANVVSSQATLHGPYGGVVPELASRAHLENIGPVLAEAFLQAGLDRERIHLLAVTRGPGLIGSLLVGLNYAKSMAYARDLPLVGVNHLEAHFFSPFLEHPEIEHPLMALIVSGGHTSLYFSPAPWRYEFLAGTRDDAAGEAYDKVARLLGLEYPGGPVIDKAVQDGDPKAVAFPRGLTARHDMAKHRFDYSFSGLKTAVARYVERSERDGEPISVDDVAASFQEAVADVLTGKAVDACQELGIKHMVLGGGVAANSRLRTLMAERCEKAGVELRRPRPGLCTDNGAMIAVLGAQVMEAGRAPSSLEIPADSGMPVTQVIA